MHTYMHDDLPVCDPRTARVCAQLIADGGDDGLPGSPMTTTAVRKATIGEDRDDNDGGGADGTTDSDGTRRGTAG